MTVPIHRMTVAAYVAAERDAEVRHEFHAGEVFAMAGGTPEHAEIAGNILGHLRAALRDRPCRVFTSDARIAVVETGLHAYPDVTVVCGDLLRDRDDPLALVNPALLVEVTSDSTADWDRGGKFAHYRRIPTLREYLVVSQSERFVEHHTRADDDTWILRDVRAAETLRLVSLDCALPLDEIYLKVLPALAVTA